MEGRCKNTQTDELHEHELLANYELKTVLQKENELNTDCDHSTFQKYEKLKWPLTYNLLQVLLRRLDACGQKHKQ